MNLPITRLPTESLRQKSKEVSREMLLSPEVQQLISDMIPTMYFNHGIGLAAPQVGVNLQICIIGKEAVPGKKKDLVLVNPEFVRTGRRTASDTEGCLSVSDLPDPSKKVMCKVYGRVKRYAEIHVSALDENGETLEFDAKDFFARVIQHEVDHLNGTLFIDKAKDLYSVDNEE